MSDLSVLKANPALNFLTTLGEEASKAAVALVHDIVENKADHNTMVARAERLAALVGYQAIYHRVGQPTMVAPATAETKPAETKPAETKPSK